MKPTDDWMHGARLALLQAFAGGTKPDANVWVDEWAEANRVLPPDTPEPGPFRNARTPYLIDIQRTMSPASPIREGWLQKAVQVGGSVSGENLIGAWICTAAGSILVVFPTLDDGKQWELTRFEPMRANTRELRKRIRPADLKGSDNTKLRKKFPGGVLRLVGSNRVGALKSPTSTFLTSATRAAPSSWPKRAPSTSAARPRSLATARRQSKAAAPSTARSSEVISGAGSCTAPSAATPSTSSGRR